VHYIFRAHDAVSMTIQSHFVFSSRRQIFQSFQKEQLTHTKQNAGVSLFRIQPPVLYLVLLSLAGVAAFMGPASPVASTGIKNLNVAMNKHKGFMVARQGKIKSGSVLGLSCSADEVGLVHVSAILVIMQNHHAKSHLHRHDDDRDTKYVPREYAQITRVHDMCCSVCT
jgi:hypothetical protein